MLCRKCWSEEASVHFHTLYGGEFQHVGYCLACAQDDPWSWLLAWGHGREPAPDGLFGTPIVVRAERVVCDRANSARTLVATGLRRCECGCGIVVGAEVASGHDAFAYDGEAQVVSHMCHCGREHAIVMPGVVSQDGCGIEGRPVIATAQTCLWDEQRRRLVGVHNDLHRNRTTWGTFSLKN